ncbi:DUF3237 domain-containing protein [Novosphingobium piscinae]|uniref:UPF0311 protein H7F53_10505 n=2 Tax=Novosphingobium piscinae TaxID=1507448 RepID=A0A7X1FYY8_9SPHN|nr:DUF3237 domain-containing protein [Novosphingobium piscinae]
MRTALATAAASVLAGPAGAGPAAPAPTLEYAFTVTAEVAPAIEQGTVDGGRKRFIAITGGKVEGPMMSGSVLPGGGDWQVIEANGVTRVEARYFLRTVNGTVVEVTNPGVRVASPEVIERLSRGEVVDPSLYYFRTTPNFKVADGPYDWLRRHAFVARGVRQPDKVLIDFYVVK